MAYQGTKKYCDEELQKRIVDATALLQRAFSFFQTSDLLQCAVHLQAHYFNLLREFVAKHGPAKIPTELEMNVFASDIRMENEKEAAEQSAEPDGENTTG